MLSEVVTEPGRGRDNVPKVLTPHRLTHTSPTVSICSSISRTAAESFRDTPK